MKNKTTEKICKWCVNYFQCLLQSCQMDIKKAWVGGKKEIGINTSVCIL